MKPDGRHWNSFPGGFMPPRKDGPGIGPASAETDDRRGFLKRLLGLAAGGAAVALGGTALTRGRAEASAIDPYLGEIMLFAGSYAPRGWAPCNGQLLPINQNQGLFSLLGTYYGGNGQTTFALPDLRGRAPIHVGQGPGLTDRTLGEQGGEETHLLTVEEMPAHTHLASAYSGNGTSASPAGLLPARDPSGTPHYGAGADVTLSPGAIGVTGGNQAHNNMQPFLALTFCICVQGVFPQQS
jgi:microcystin-dependent protein